MADPHESGVNALPLRGVVLCCTSVAQEHRTDISNKAAQMGAKCVLDLTSDVTHLICGGLGSPKYQYVARMRSDVKVLAPKWVEAMYRQWLSGDDVNIHEFEREHKFPALFELKISVTGIPDVAERKRVEMRCIQNGATYHPDLTKQVTHLIAAAPTGKKYDFAVLNNINVVHPAWLADSLERGMALEEKYYNPNLPPDRVGVGAKPAPLVNQSELADYRGKRKIRKATEEKLGSQSLNIWDDIMGHASNSRVERHDEWEDRPAPAVAQSLESHGLSTPAAEPPKKTGVLGDVAVYIYGFDKKKTATLRTALDSLAASVVASADVLTGSKEAFKCVLLPRDMQTSEYPTLPNDKVQVVTEWWLEACLHHKYLVQPSDNDITTMRFETYPMPGFNDLDVCISLFSGIELTHWSKLVPMMGARFHETLTAARSLLIVNAQVPPKGAKISYALAKGIPIVKSDWLIACIREQRKVPFDGFQLGGQKKFQIEGQSMLLPDGDASKRKADDDNEGLYVPGVDTPKRRRSQMGGVSGNGSVPGNQPQQTRSGKGGVAKDESKRHEALILSGCRVLVSYEELPDRKSELEALAHKLGAEVVVEAPTVGDLSLTHIIRLSLPKTDNADFQTLQRNSRTCSIVSPDWLVQCRDSKSRVDEAAHPPSSLRHSSTSNSAKSSNTSSRTRTVAGPTTTTKSASPNPQLPASSTRLVQASPSLPPPLPPPKLPEPSSNQENHDLIPPVILEPPSSVPTVPLHDAVPEILNSRPAPRRTNEPPLPPPPDPRWSGISQLLVSVDKSALANAIDKPTRRPRTRLQGKLTGAARQFSRTPSYASSSASQQALDEAAEEKERPHVLQMSQAVEYRSEEDEMERRRVRRRLDPNAAAAEGDEGDEGLGGGERRLVGMQKAIDADEGVGSVARRTRRSGAL